MGPGSCGLSGIFDSCQSDKNAANINCLFDVASSLSDSVQELDEETNDKFYIVKELHKLHDLQEQLRSVQNANWEVMATQMDTFKQDMQLMRNCDQMLYYSRQHINFNFDTVSSLLSLFSSNKELPSCSFCLSNQFAEYHFSSSQQVCSYVPVLQGISGNCSE